MPSVVVGAEVRRKRVLNCCPWVRSLTHSPPAVTHSPAEMLAACPTTVTRSRWPRALMRRTQKPFSALWNVTRSMRPARLPGSRSRAADSARRSRSPELHRGQQFLEGGELLSALSGRLRTFAERVVLLLDFGRKGLPRYPFVFDPSDVGLQFLGREQASHAGNKLGQLPREDRAPGGGVRAAMDLRSPAGLAGLVRPQRAA